MLNSILTQNNNDSYDTTLRFNIYEPEIPFDIQNKALDNKSIMIKFVWDISNAFRGLLHKLPSYGISMRVFLIIKPFLSGRAMKALLMASILMPWDQCRRPHKALF